MWSPVAWLLRVAQQLIGAKTARSAATKSGSCSGRSSPQPHARAELALRLRIGAYCVPHRHASLCLLLARSVSSSYLTNEEQFSALLNGSPREAFGLIRTSDPNSMRIVQSGFDKEDLLPLP